jgi:hypothetical protein
LTRRKEGATSKGGKGRKHGGCGCRAKVLQRCVGDARRVAPGKDVAERMVEVVLQATNVQCRRRWDVRPGRDWDQHGRQKEGQTRDKALEGAVVVV